MPKIDVPNETVAKIMEENGINPDRFCVLMQDESTIILRNYKTRDDVVIHQGDKPWSKRI